MRGAESGHVEKGNEREGRASDVDRQAARRASGTAGMAGYILYLQRTVGNQAVGQWLRQQGLQHPRQLQRSALLGDIAHGAPLDGAPSTQIGRELQGDPRQQAAPASGVRDELVELTCEAMHGESSGASPVDEDRPADLPDSRTTELESGAGRQGSNMGIRADSGKPAQLNFHVAAQASLPIQRVIKTRIKDGEWHFYSDVDADQMLYKTELEAEKKEKKLIESGEAIHPEYSEKKRPNTLFSYASTAPHNKLNNLQAPHVVGYGAVHKALTDSKQPVNQIFSEQVREPSAVEDDIKEKTKYDDIDNAQSKAKIDRFVHDYKSTFVAVGTMIKDGIGDEIIKPRIEWLVNVDPISSTNWSQTFKTKSSRPPKSKTKGKGETKDLTEIGNVDTKGATEEGRKNAGELWKKRLRLLPDTDAKAGALKEAEALIKGKMEEDPIEEEEMEEAVGEEEEEEVIEEEEESLSKKRKTK